MTSPAPVHYQVNGDNAPLHTALFLLAKGRCYWCRRTFEYSVTEIDHIIPHTLDADRVSTIRTRLTLPADFDLHAPSNLALICRPDNNAKRDSDFTESGILLTYLRDARNRADAVIEIVQGQRTNRAVARAVQDLLVADLAAPATRKLVETHAQALIGKLGSLGYDVLGTAVVSTVQVDIGEDADAQTATLAIAARVVTAVTLLEEICGQPVQDVLQPGIQDLLAQADDLISENLADIDGPGAPFTVGDIERVDLQLTVEALDAHRDATGIAFTVRGSMIGYYAADLEPELSAAAVSREYEDLADDDVHADSETASRFVIEVHADLAAPAAPGAPGAPETVKAELDWGEPTTLLWNTTTLEVLPRSA